MSELWRIIDLIKWAESYFKKKNISNPKSEIEWLLCSLLGYSKLDLYLKFEEQITKANLTILRSWVKRRLNNEPLQYITKSCYFYGRKFFITPDVLIPRPETERIVDIAIKKINEIKSPQILDIGTGSGCIASTLALERPDSNVWGIDISPNAIKIANENKSIFLLNNVEFLIMNILKEHPKRKFDLIVSNPPYIPKEDIRNLMKDVKNFEPHIALTDQKDGLTFYRRLSKIGKTNLKLGSWIIIEVGQGDHPEASKSLFDQSQYLNVSLIKDYNGDNRVLIAQV